jgi:hypothetical protein
MQTYLTTAMIKAPPEQVWRVLTDAPGYASWNPEIIAMAGRIALGERIKASVRVKAGGGTMAVRTVPLKVPAFEPPSPPRQRGSMEWTRGLPFGLFKGQRVLSVAPAVGGTDFRMELRMSGPMLGMILKSVGDRQPEIDSFAAALKARAEQA